MAHFVAQSGGGADLSLWSSLSAQRYGPSARLGCVQVNNVCQVLMMSGRMQRMHRRWLWRVLRLCLRLLSLWPSCCSADTPQHLLDDTIRTRRMPLGCQLLNLFTVCSTILANTPVRSMLSHSLYSALLQLFEEAPPGCCSNPAQAERKLRGQCKF